MIDIGSFVPDDQQQKLAIIADAQSILAATLAPPATPPAPITPDQVRLAAKTALAQIDPALAKLPPDHPLAAIAGDLRQLQTASDSVAMATNAALTRFLPEELGPPAHRAECRAGDAGIDPARHGARLAAAGRSGAACR